jgi:hypothetical protein
MARRRVMLTTVDNPWNPFTHFEEWLNFDQAHGYNTNGLLARFTDTSSDLPDDLIEADLEDAIDRIVRLNPLGVHKRVYADA